MHFTGWHLVLQFWISIAILGEGGTFVSFNHDIPFNCVSHSLRFFCIGHLWLLWVSFLRWYFRHCRWLIVFLILFSQEILALSLGRTSWVKLWLINLNFSWYVLHFMLLFSGFTFNFIRFPLIFIKCLLFCFERAACFLFFIWIYYIFYYFASNKMQITTCKKSTKLLNPFQRYCWFISENFGHARP